MKDSRNSVKKIGAVMVRLDEDTHNRLIRAKENSGRSKANEANLRLTDHLKRFPDFYSSEYIDEFNNN